MISLSAAAQQKIKIDWQEATRLPADNGALHIGVAGPLTGVYNNVLIVAGGANFPQAMPWMGGAKKYHNTAYVFRRASNGSLTILQTTKLPVVLAYSACVTTPQGIVCAGGEGDNGVTGKVLLLQWIDGSLITKELPSLPNGFTNGAIAYCDDIVYLAGGENSTKALNQFYYLNMQQVERGWQALPTLPQPTSHAVLAVQERKGVKQVYLVGGRRKTTSGISELYKQVYAFNLQTKTWGEEAPLPYALSAASGIAAGNNTLLVFSGDRGETFHQAEKLIAAINKEADAAKKEALNKQKAALQAGHPGFSKEVLAYNTINKKWKVVSVIPFDAPVTTTAVCWEGSIYIPSGEIRAGVRTPQVLKGEIKK